MQQQRSCPLAGAATAAWPLLAPCRGRGCRPSFRLARFLCRSRPCEGSRASVSARSPGIRLCVHPALKHAPHGRRCKSAQSCLLDARQACGGSPISTTAALLRSARSAVEICIKRARRARDAHTAAPAAAGRASRARAKLSHAPRSRLEIFPCRRVRLSMLLPACQRKACVVLRPARTHSQTSRARNLAARRARSRGSSRRRRARRHPAVICAPAAAAAHARREPEISAGTSRENDSCHSAAIRTPTRQRASMPRRLRVSTPTGARCKEPPRSGHRAVPRCAALTRERG
jgi:hypothetical protein